MSKDNKFTYNPKEPNRKLIEKVTAILDGYGNLRPTIRNLHYRLVATNFHENTSKTYKRTSEVTTKARYAGMIDWHRIDDRLRKPQLPYTTTSPRQAMLDIIDAYQLDRMGGQDRYIEVWSEKDSIQNVLYPITSKYGIRLMVNRGYGSVTALFEGADRFFGKPDPLILYFGDHDPSGLDMLRDIDSRLERMGSPVEMVPLALTVKQIIDLDLPPNWAKLTDSRSGYNRKTGQVRPGSYIDIHGWESWELDAIPIDIMEAILDGAIRKRIDLDKYNKVLEQEKVDKTELSKIINK